jgi:hypothetical protein
MGWGWVHLVLRPLFGLLYQPQMIEDDDCAANGGMKIGRGNRSIRRKPAPAQLCPPQIPHDLTRARTRATAVIYINIYIYYKNWSSRQNLWSSIVMSYTIRQPFYFIQKRKGKRNR